MQKDAGRPASYLFKILVFGVKDANISIIKFKIQNPKVGMIGLVLNNPVIEFFIRGFANKDFSSH